MSLGAVAWDDMFENDDLKLPDTNFMNRMRKAITCEQFQQIANDMLKKMSDKKEDFCKGNYYTLQEAKIDYMLS